MLEVNLMKPKARLTEGTIVRYGRARGKTEKKETPSANRAALFPEGSEKKKLLDIFGKSGFKPVGPDRWKHLGPGAGVRRGMFRAVQAAFNIEAAGLKIGDLKKKEKS